MEDGAAERIRTSDLCLRRAALYTYTIENAYFFTDFHINIMVSDFASVAMLWSPSVCLKKSKCINNYVKSIQLMVVVTNQSLSVQTYCETATLVQNLVRQQIYMMTHQSWNWCLKITNKTKELSPSSDAGIIQSVMHRYRS